METTIKKQLKQFALESLDIGEVVCFCSNFASLPYFFLRGFNVFSWVPCRDSGPSLRGLKHFREWGRAEGEVGGGRGRGRSVLSFGIFAIIPGAIYTNELKSFYYPYELDLAW